MPEAAITTDIIVGFPGETDADFEATMEVAAAAEFDSAYTFVFSPRPGTEAAEAIVREGAQEVHACCAHAVLSGPAVDRIGESSLKSMVRRVLGII